jgi:hypothetical protein
MAAAVMPTFYFNWQHDTATRHCNKTVQQQHALPTELCSAYAITQLGSARPVQQALE